MTVYLPIEVVATLPRGPRFRLLSRSKVHKLLVQAIRLANNPVAYLKFADSFSWEFTPGNDTYPQLADWPVYPRTENPGGNH